MPWGDRTGPWGMGPRTGWHLGYGSGYSMPGNANPNKPGGGRRAYGGRGWGRGFGCGRGFGRWRYAPAMRQYAPGPGYAPYYAGTYESTAEQEKSYLEELSKTLEEQLSEIKERLTELASKKAKE